MQSLFLSILSSCPVQFYLLLRIPSLILLTPVISDMVSFLTFCGHHILWTFLRHVNWNLSGLFSSVVVIFQASHPHNSTDHISVLNSLIFMLWPILHTCFPDLHQVEKSLSCPIYTFLYTLHASTLLCHSCVSKLLYIFHFLIFNLHSVFSSCIQSHHFFLHLASVPLFCIVYQSVGFVMFVLILRRNEDYIFSKIKSSCEVRSDAVSLSFCCSLHHPVNREQE